MAFFQAVLVDVDGTAVDCEKRNRSVLEDAAIQHGGKIEQADWKHLAGTNDRHIHHWLQNKFSKFTIPADDFIEEVKQGYLRRSFEVVARDGMMDNFRHMQRLNIPVAAVTNSPADIAKANLDAAGCTQYMEFILSATEVTQAGYKIKPAPDPYLMAANMLELHPALCLVFEDSATGVAAAKAAGSMVIQIVDDPSMKSPLADQYVYTPNELRRICRQLIIA